MPKEGEMLREIIYLTRLIRKNYPSGQHTFAQGPTLDCERQGRGGGLCGYCLEAELGKLIGENQAKEVHNKFR